MCVCVCILSLAFKNLFWVHALNKHAGFAGADQNDCQDAFDAGSDGPSEPRHVAGTEQPGAAQKVAPEALRARIAELEAELKDREKQPGTAPTCTQAWHATSKRPASDQQAWHATSMSRYS